MKGVIFDSQDEAARAAYQIWIRRGGNETGRKCTLKGSGPHEKRPHMLVVYPSDVFMFLYNALTNKHALVILDIMYTPPDAVELAAEWGVFGDILKDG